MKVTLTFGDVMGRELLRIADEDHVRVTDVIFRTVKQLVGSRLPLRDRIPVMVRAGLPDAVIAQRLNVSHEFVAKVRRRSGLRSNRMDHDLWIDDFRKAS